LRWDAAGDHVVARPGAAPAAPGPAAASAAGDESDNSFALLGAAVAAHQKRQAAAPAGERRTHADPTLDDEPGPRATPEQIEQLAQVDSACRETVQRLVDELDLCRRYYESTFPNRPVDRLLFVGGEARQRMLCQHIAREMQVAAQVGDPMIRMARTCEIGLESGIDRRQPQPGWAVAIGLSMGPANIPAEARS
jgi:Tfp pilus assembly PilM family ATPase